MKTLLITTLFIFISCGGGGGGGGANDEPVITKNELIGFWKLPDLFCVENTDVETAFAQSVMLGFTIDESKIRFGTIYFSSLDCTGSELAYYVLDYSYEIQNSDEIKLIPIDEFINIADAATVTTVNNNSLCGINNWSEGVSVSVLNTTCTANPIENIWFNVNVTASQITYTTASNTEVVLERVDLD